MYQMLELSTNIGIGIGPQNSHCGWALVLSIGKGPIFSNVIYLYYICVREHTHGLSPLPVHGLDAASCLSGKKKNEPLLKTKQNSACLLFLCAFLPRPLFLLFFHSWLQ